MVPDELNNQLYTRLTVNVGITGHRDLPDADFTLLHKKFNEIFKELKLITAKVYHQAINLYKPETTVLRLLSALAEGSDRIAAETALENGFEMQCPLPFEKNEYSKDFKTSESQTQFFTLLSQAKSVFEIAGKRDNESSTYQHTGEIILGHSDVLIAVWDGLINNKIGGTSDIVGKAKEQNVPVIWINAKNKHDIFLIYNGNVHKQWKHELSTILLQIFSSHSLHESLEKAYFNEKKRKWNIAVFNTIFLNLITKRFFKKISIKAEKILQNAENGWYKLWPEKNEKIRSFRIFSDRFYKPYYVWTDFLSTFYAERYRTAGLFQHLFYFFSTIGYGIGLYYGFWLEVDTCESTSKTLVIRGIGFSLQAVFLLSIIWMRRRNDIGRWHQKFIDYRILAELLRQTIFLNQLGASVRGLNLPSFNKDADANWINWYYRGILREGGIPSIYLDEKQSSACSSIIKDVLDDQIAYHKANTKKNKAIHKRLEKFGNYTYVVSLTFIVVRVIFSFVHAFDITGFQAFFANIHFTNSHDVEKSLNLFCLLLPALATVAHAIAEQGGFERLEHRSNAMVNDFVQIKKRLEHITPDDYTQLKTIAENTASLMLTEVIDWRILVKQKIIKNH